jgi:hypothetical protein
MVGSTLQPGQLYRRQARRLRVRYAGRPAELYRSLRQLSDRHDAMQAAPQPVPMIDASQHRAKAFAQFVVDRLDGQVLRYSTRLELLKIAERIGIGRFHANLLIAAVQHQAGQPATCPPTSAGRHANRRTIALIVLLIQSIILLAAWLLFLR